MQAEWAPSRSSESFSLGAWLVDPRHLSRGELALAFLIYAACWELGFVVSTEYWFLPAGVRIAALLRMQTTQWPVLLLAEWLAIAVYETTVGPGYRTSLGALLGVVGPFFCTGAFIYVWRRTACPDPAEAPRKLIKLLTSIVLAAGAAAVVLSLMLVSEGRLGFDRFAWNVASYWGGDVVGVLVISPLLIQLGQPRPIWMRREVWRYCLTTMLPVWVALLLAMGFAPSVVPHLVLIVLLPPVWMAFKAGWRGASLSLTLTSIALYMVPDAVRPTLQPSLVQLLVAIMGFLTLLLGSWVNAERFSREKLDAHLTKLAEANDALRQKSDAMRVLAQRLVHAQESERSLLRARLARDLGRAVDALSAHLSLLARDVDHPQHLALVDTLRTLVQDVRNAMSDCFEELQPAHGLLQTVLESGPIGRALESAGIVLQVQSDTPDIEVQEGRGLLLFRIVQHLASMLLKRGDGRRLDVRAVHDAGGSTLLRVSATLSTHAPWDVDAFAADHEFVALRDRVLAEGGVLGFETRDPGAVQVDIDLPPQR